MPAVGAVRVAVARFVDVLALRTYVPLPMRQAHEFSNRNLSDRCELINIEMPQI